MNMKHGKKITALVVASAVTVGSLGVAYAWWSTTGSGEGSASTTAGVDDVLDFTTSTINAMYPGDSSQSFDVTVKNTDANESVEVDTVKAWITTGNAGCDGSDFKLNGFEAPSLEADAVELNWTPVELVAGGDQVSTNTIQFNDKPENQDDCKMATVTLHYAVPAAV